MITEMVRVREQFPMLEQDIVYLDSAALVQKPLSVIKAVNDFYSKFCISNRTSDSYLGIFVEKKIKETRNLVANLLDAETNEIIFNSGTTEGLNYSASILYDLVNEDDEILISKYNHSSHIIPWIELAKQKKAKIVFSDNLLKDVNSGTRIICLTQVNNNFNIKIDLRLLKEKANEYNSIIVNDAAQAISHQKVSSQFSDVIAFSSNKIFGPTGLGVLYINKKLLQKISSKKYGGGSVDYIKLNGDWKRKGSISQHEPGTLNLGAIFGFHEALIFFNSLDKKSMQKYLLDLSNYAYDKLIKIKNVKIESRRGDNIILFNVLSSNSQDVSSYLGHKNIYVRSGFFCAQYLNNIIDQSLIRVSLHIYNNKDDINKFIKVLSEGNDFLDFL